MNRQAVSRNVQIAAILIVLIVAASAAYFLLPGPSGDEEPAEGITLKVITRHDTTLTRKAKEEFLQSQEAQQHNVSNIEFLSPSPAYWRSIIDGQGDIDVAWGGGPTLFDDLVVDGFLAAIEDSELLAEAEEIMQEVGGAPTIRRGSEDEVLWIGSAIGGFGFIINMVILTEYGLPEPALWEDLASPEFGATLPKPQIAYARSLTSTSNTRIYEIILEKFGWDRGWSILARIAANGIFTGGSVEAQTKVENNEVAVSIAIDFYGYSSELKYPHLKYVTPQGESIANADPIALLRTSRHVDAAQAFIKWVISVEGQKIWLDPNINRMPMREDVWDTAEGQARPELYEHFRRTLDYVGIQINDTKWLQVEFGFRYYFDAVFADMHGSLVDFWSELVGAYLDGEISLDQFEELALEMGRPLTFTEPSPPLGDGMEHTYTLEYAMAINEAMKNSQFSSEITSHWRDAARNRYAELLEHLRDLLS